MRGNLGTAAALVLCTVSLWVIISRMPVKSVDHWFFMRENTDGTPIFNVIPAHPAHVKRDRNA